MDTIMHGRDDELEPGEVRTMSDSEEREFSKEMHQLLNKGDHINDTSLKAGYDAQRQRIEQLESWVAEVIAKPSMTREMRLEGLDLVEAQRPDVRQSVERICPRAQGLERTLEIER